MLKEIEIQNFRCFEQIKISGFERVNLIGGKNYEPHEENPMIGFRGAARYVDKSFRDCFELECRAVKD